MNVTVEICKQVNLLKLVEIEVPEVKGTFNGRFTREVACPKCGGHTRFRYRCDLNDHSERVFCSHCAPGGLNAIKYAMWMHDYGYKDAVKWLLGVGQKVGPANKYVPPPLVPLDPQIAIRCHEAPGIWREYFYSRGINDEWIDRAMLGYSLEYGRYAIPCFQKNDQGVNELWGIQYRMRPEVERRIRERGEKPARYLSEKGGHNHRLFNTDAVSKPLPYALVVEGPLDALSLSGFGIPAVACFHGNNKSKAWDTAWNKHLSQVSSILIIPDNDVSGMGDLIALSKLNDIPRAAIYRLPGEFKDAGKLIEHYVPQGRDAVAAALSQWLGKPLLKD